MDFNQMMQTVTTIGIAFGLKVAGAVIRNQTGNGTNP